MKYKVTKAVGGLRVGQIVDDRDWYIRRKIQEGGCMEPVDEKKMQKPKYENKMIDEKSIDNKKSKEDKQ